VIVEAYVYTVIRLRKHGHDVDYHVIAGASNDFPGSAHCRLAK